MTTRPSTLMLEHVLRPQPPWHAQATTECGQLARAVSSVLTVEQLQVKLRREGLPKAKVSLCSTCFNAARRRTRERKTH